MVFMLEILKILLCFVSFISDLIAKIFYVLASFFSNFSLVVGSVVKVVKVFFELEVVLLYLCEL